MAFDIATGKELWTQPLSTAQKAPPVLADGKIYVGTDGGKFFIIRPGADRAQILSEVELPNSVTSCCGSEGTPEQILGGAAVSRGRIFFVSSDAVYAIGPRQARAVTGFAVNTPAETGAGAPAHVQVTPTELVLEPGETVRLRARLFDDKGRFLREEKATWSLEGLKGTVADGAFTVASDPRRAGRPDQGDRRRRSPARRARASCARCRGTRRSSRMPTARCRPAGSTPSPARFR